MKNRLLKAVLISQLWNLTSVKVSLLCYNTSIVIGSCQEHKEHEENTKNTMG